MRIPVALAALLALSVLAGCFQASKTPATAPTQTVVPADAVGYQFTGLDSKGLPVPKLLCRPMIAGEEAIHNGGAGQRCNYLMTPDEARQGNEVTIAVNPTDPKNIVGGAKDYYPADAGDCVWDGVYVTHDGGATQWQDRSFDGSPWHLRNGDTAGFKQNYASTFWCTTDPVAYFDVNGVFYYLLMGYQADPVTGSKTCKDVCPQGGLNDWAFNRAAQIVAVSHDGGDTFDTFTPVLEGSFPIDFHDKGWVAASKDGTIHVMWLASLAPGNLYFRSIDKGKSYGDPVVMASTIDNSGQGSFLDVGTDNEVYATWLSGAGEVLRRSDDTGATWDPARVVLTPNISDMTGLSDRDRRSVSPMFATDRNPDSPFQNALYYVWQDECTGDWAVGCTGDSSSVYFSSSFDTGKTFSKPMRISTPHDGRADFEIMPAVSVSPGGVIDVAWFDTEGGRIADPSHTFTDNKPHMTFEEHYAYSLDGGKTWSKELSIRDAADNGWDPALSHHQDGKIFFGDYADIDSSWQAAHPVWPDTRDGKSVKVYTAEIQRPMFAEGWDIAKQAKALEFIAKHPLA
jgi:hypothetical protein